MTYSILTGLLFGFWGIVCILYWVRLHKISRKYPGGVFNLKDVISQEDNEQLKKERARLLLGFIIWIVLLLLFFVLQITGNLFPGNK